jgi:transposase
VSCSKVKVDNTDHEDLIMTNQTHYGEVILGVDTHLDIHVGAVISSAGKLLGTRTASVTLQGYNDLYEWALASGPLKRAGVENTGTYDAGTFHLLDSKQIQVLEVDRPDRSTHRSRGKSDPIDTENAARSVLSGISTAIPKNKMVSVKPSECCQW